eukprot:scaffold2090_cov103-Cylindrotheca_fusiformis.AAC.10
MMFVLLGFNAAKNSFLQDSNAGTSISVEESFPQFELEMKSLLALDKLEALRGYLQPLSYCYLVVRLFHVPPIWLGLLGHVGGSPPLSAGVERQFTVVSIIGHMPGAKSNDLTTNRWGSKAFLIELGNITILSKAENVPCKNRTRLENVGPMTDVKRPTVQSLGCTWRYFQGSEERKRSKKQDNKTAKTSRTWERKPEQECENFEKPFYMIRDFLITGRQLRASQ